MAKNYYSELKKEHRFYSTSPGGWEIHVEWDEYFDTDWRTGKTRKVGREIVRMPRGVPREDRASFRLSLAMDKRVARAVQTKEEYNALWKRIGREDFDYIIKKDLQGEALVRWAFNTHTSQEYYNLLRYN